MKRVLKNKAGNILVLVCVTLPIFIAMLGMCLDGSLVLYYQTKLMAATKFAAISASANNKVVSDKTIITGTQQEAATALETNFSEAKLRSFTINSSSKNKCTVVAETNVNFVFMRVFGIKNKTLSESYTVTRK